MQIPFHRVSITDSDLAAVKESLLSGEICGDSSYTRKCTEWLNAKCAGEGRSLLTTSGTHALELAALLAGIVPGDEVIMPSFTFTSTANAFTLRGAKIVFVDVRTDTMNIDERLIEEAITSKTKAIVPVHYAGIACEMDTINAIAKKHDLYVIEDAAQALLSTYRGIPLGALSDFGAFSFHGTKNITCGEGGALVIREKEDFLNAEIIREKGTNRSQFFRGEVDKYTWQMTGSSYLPSDILAALLYSQFLRGAEIVAGRLALWNYYYENLQSLLRKGAIELPHVPEGVSHNGHIFYIKAKDLNERTRLMDYLKTRGVKTTFHYVPLHSSKAGVQYGRFCGEDRYTTRDSERLLRLPLFSGLNLNEIDYVVDSINDFYTK